MTDAAINALAILCAIFGTLVVIVFFLLLILLIKLLWELITEK